MINLHTYLLRLRQSGADIRVLLTRHARTMVSEVPLHAVTGCEVYSDHDVHGLPVPHADLAGWADSMLVLPATANALGKAANGVADDLMTTTLLCVDPPVIFVPSMNQRMWSRPSVRRNVRILEEDGHTILRRTGSRPVTELSSSQPVLSELMPEPDQVVARLRLSVHGGGAVTRQEESGSSAGWDRGGR